jgi:hypothetical protein
MRDFMADGSPGGLLETVKQSRTESQQKSAQTARKNAAFAFRSDALARLLGIVVGLPLDERPFWRKIRLPASVRIR